MHTSGTQLTPNVVDYDVHGCTSIRVIDADSTLLSELDRTLATFRSTIVRQPDIVIRCLNRLATPSSREVVPKSTRMCEQGLILTEPLGQKKALIPFEQIGSHRCEIYCERGIRRVPLLWDIIAVTVSRRNWLCVHSSAFVHDGSGIMVAGPPGCGKTGVLLAFVRRGATYIGDELVLVDTDAQRMLGIPVPVEVSMSHCVQAPEIRRSVPLSNRAKWSLFGFTVGAAKLGRLPLDERIVKSPCRMKASIAPSRLFQKACVSGAKLDFLFIISSAANPADVSCRPLSQTDGARWLLLSSAGLYSSLFRHYAAWRGAFPHCSNEFLETFNDRVTALASKTLQNVCTFELGHSYPNDLAADFAAVQSVVG